MLKQVQQKVCFWILNFFIHQFYYLYGQWCFIENWNTRNEKQSKNETECRLSILRAIYQAG